MGFKAFIFSPKGLKKGLKNSVEEWFDKNIEKLLEFWAIPKFEDFMYI